MTESTAAAVRENAIVPQETEDADAFPRPDKAELENRQLSLFQSFLANTDEQRGQLSNAIDLWDSVPCYSVSRQAMTKGRIEGEFLRKHQITFQHRGSTYKCIISPARVADFDGVDRDFYPSASEQLVEDALRKLAIEKQAGYFDKPNYRSGVMFTLYELREEMRRRGHSRSYQEIVQSLNILSHSVIDIVPEGSGKGKAVISSACLPTLAAVSRSDLLDDPEAKWAVQFHPLVTGSIDQVTYRQYNYHRMMSHSTQLARWLHKQLVLKYTFADHLRPFEMRYSTIRRDSGLLEGYARDRDKVKAVRSVFDELKAQEVISKWEAEEETGPRRKVLDVVFTIYPSSEFIREAKAGNRRKSDAEKPVGIGRGSSNGLR
jgi:hypothetical protein